MCFSVNISQIKILQNIAERLVPLQHVVKKDFFFSLQEYFTREWQEVG